MEYPPRVYDLSLHTVGLIIGFLLLAVHLVALLRPEQTKGWLVQLPRSRPLGIGLLALDSVWAFWLVSNMDLGEFCQKPKLVPNKVSPPPGFFLCFCFCFF